MSILAYAELATKLIGPIMNLVSLAERFFGGGTGAQKKELVTAATKEIFTGMKAVSTGGQLESWTEAEEPVSKMIDLAAGLLFPKKEEIDLSHN